MTQNNRQIKFDKWKENVDSFLLLLCNMSSDDIDDWTYADDFDAGFTPKQSAKRAYKNAKEACGLV